MSRHSPCAVLPGRRLRRGVRLALVPLGGCPRGDMFPSLSSKVHSVVTPRRGSVRVCSEGER